MVDLWHYTCAHGCQDIGSPGVLKPLRLLADRDQFASWADWRLPLLDLIWLTDLDFPMREALGLTSATLGCDRTRYRYRVTGGDPVYYPSIRRRLPKELRADLEHAPGALPAHWWVAYADVPVEYDPELVGTR